MQNSAKMLVSYHLWQEKVHVNEIAARMEVHRATVYRWISNFKLFGVSRSIQRYEDSKKGSRFHRRLDKEVIDAIVQIRKDYEDCCGEKVSYYLAVDYGLRASVSTVYRYLKEKGLVRKHRKRGTFSKSLEKAKAEREQIQVDTVDFGKVYAYTFVDTYTRQAKVVMKPSLTAKDGKSALDEAMRCFNSAIVIQSDGGSEFKKEFSSRVLAHCKRHRVSRPYKKNEQAYIESFNRSLRFECLKWDKYEVEDIDKVQAKVDKWIDFYNNKRPHLGLRMRTPNDVAICRI